ncbi:MAG: SDR family NAD(P)-dependent oxidoreductase, partial [Anaerobacillus sp.]
MIQNENLKGKVAAVTGGSGVLCSAMAKELGRLGVKVAILNRNNKTGQEVVDQIRNAGGEALSVSCDVLDRTSVEEAEAIISNTYGACDILINGAGGNHKDGTTTHETMKEEDLT